VSTRLKIKGISKHIEPGDCANHRQILKMVILPFAVPAAVAAGIYLIRKQREYAWGEFTVLYCCSLGSSDSDAHFPLP
jgi:hypothetical protein